jgi:hypothetical protein
VGFTVRSALRRSEEIWGRLEELGARHGLIDRCLVGLFDALMGMRVRNSTYRTAHHEMGDEISEVSATRDLRQMLDAGVDQRTRREAGQVLRSSGAFGEIRSEVVAMRDPEIFSDPFRPD